MSSTSPRTEVVADAPYRFEGLNLVNLPGAGWLGKLVGSFLDALRVKLVGTLLRRSLPPRFTQSSLHTGLPSSLGPKCAKEHGVLWLGRLIRALIGARPAMLPGGVLLLGVLCLAKLLEVLQLVGIQLAMLLGVLQLAGTLLLAILLGVRLAMLPHILQLAGTLWLAKLFGVLQLVGIWVAMLPGVLQLVEIGPAMLPALLQLAGTLRWDSPACQAFWGA
eukprot:CAMPEP_0181467992 /NCGR_PEP_ID=MMETSP1110-20121109/37265_1 /TAXON_ID=174948 /ORGANISM="Symbiodinium sp., Strain CCMP421" /LENGTH=219 /DNA_ID=CAMNT_0023592837 /DNA_START=40 /DNA_END=696 /DNA_ORIENTATION=-